jgi:hypothetical protein
MPKSGSDRSIRIYAFLRNENRMAEQKSKARIAAGRMLAWLPDQGSNWDLRINSLSLATALKKSATAMA